MRRAMVCYTMVQELATWLHYHNVREQARRRRAATPPYTALSRWSPSTSAPITISFAGSWSLYLEDDREGTLEQLRRVVNGFAMPAVHLLADSRKRTQEVKDLRIFDYDMYVLSGFRANRASLAFAKIGPAAPAMRREVMLPTSASA